MQRRGQGWGAGACEGGILRGLLAIGYRLVENEGSAPFLTRGTRIRSGGARAPESGTPPGAFPAGGSPPQQPTARRISRVVSGFPVRNNGGDSPDRRLRKISAMSLNRLLALLTLVSMAVWSPVAAAQDGGAVGEAEAPAAEPAVSEPTSPKAESGEADLPEVDPPDFEAPEVPLIATEEPAAEDEGADVPMAEAPAGAPPAAPPADPDNPGQESLDRAIERKLDAQELKDLNEVVDLLDEAIEKGLDADNTDFAEELLVATLLQRAMSYSQVVLGQPVADPRRDPRWLTVRTYALTDLGRVVALDESKAEAWLLVGRLQSLPMGNPSEARRALSRVIRLADEAKTDPDAEAPDAATIAQAYALRGAAQKEDPERMADFDRAVELAPDKAEYLLLRAQAHRAAERAEECLADIDRAIELAPESPRVHELRALALLMQDRQEEALASFDRASELAPDLLSPYQYRGELYSQLGKPEEAIAQLDKALEIQPNNLASLLIRAQLLTAAEQHEKALADVEAVLTQQPGLVRAHLLKAQALDALGRTDEAVAWLEKLVAIDPDRPELQMQLAAFYVDKEMAPEAIEVLTRVLELDEGNELARRLRGDMYLFKGEHENAIADFKRALEQSPAEPGVLNNYAWTLATSPYEAVRDGAKAVELATKACEATGYGAPHILSTLAAAYAESGDFDEAVKRSEEAIRKAEEMKSLDDFDGQLEAELRSYRAREPWRELQRLGVSGPASEATTKMAEAEAASKPQDPPQPASKPDPAVVDETPARSIDF